MPAKKTTQQQRKRSWLETLEHPLAAIVGLITIATFLGGSIVGAINLFVLKSEYIRTQEWHDVTHAKIRTERLKDEVDRYKARELVEGELSRVDKADQQVFKEKLTEAQKELDKLSETARTDSKIK